GGALERNAMADQRRDIECAACQQVQYRLKIALLRPADEADGVILSLFLVGRIVPARAIGARDLEAEFLLVEIGPVELEAGDADQYDAAALAAHLGRLGDGV